jgi:HTH-type transcriptional regulator / antitoxin HigA
MIYLDGSVHLLQGHERKFTVQDAPFNSRSSGGNHMYQNGLQPRDLIPFVGSRNRVHEVLNRKRPLTLK